jgi:probable HAF family extracellular repeat protein
MKKLVMRNKLSVLVVITLVLSMLFFVATALAAPSYLVIDLGTLSGGNMSEGYGINNSGHIVGWSEINDYGLPLRAFLHDGITMHDLGTLGGSGSLAYGINDRDKVVGEALTIGDTASHAFLYSSGTMSDLGTLGGTSSVAWGINNADQVVGWSNMTGNTSSHAFLYSGGTMTDLGTLGGTNSFSRRINNFGQVVGESQITGNAAYHAFLYSGGTLTDLGTPWGTGNSYGYGINDSGQVTGPAYLPGAGIMHTFLYSDGDMIDLGTLGGGTTSWGTSINNSGQVVGASDCAGCAGYWHAFLYDGGTMYDLNDLIPPSSGCILTVATGINDYGQITGYMSIIGENKQTSFLLTPGAAASVPEGTDVPVALSQQIDLTFTNVVSAGTVTNIFVSPETLAPTPNFIIVGGASYNITTDVIFDGFVTVCISYDPDGMSFDQQMQLQIIHYSYNTKKWENSMEKLAVDIENKRVCGVFSSLSPFAVVKPTTVFNGFFSPVDNPPTVNNAKAGQAIPVKWRLTDADGTPVSDPASFKSLTSYSIGCNDFLGDPADSVEEYAAGASGLQYMGDGVWQYNWKTPKSYAGQCRTMVLITGDGNKHEAYFKFK